MRDGLEEDAAEPRRPRLTYPFEVTPQPGSGEAVEVAPGVLWLRQPLGATSTASPEPGSGVTSNG